VFKLLYFLYNMKLPKSEKSKTVSLEAKKKAKLKDPISWFTQRFKDVYDRHGVPLDMSLKSVQKGETTTKVSRVTQLNDAFFAAVFGELGYPDSPTHYTQGSFYRYNTDSGIYDRISDGALETRICALLHRCAKEIKGKNYDVDPLIFNLSNSARLGGVIKRAKALLEKPDTFFDNTDAAFIPCNNGMLRIEDRELLPFNQSYHIRNKLDVDYIPGAKCPLFLGKLLCDALELDQIKLAQRWGGMALLGENVDHRILLTMGTSGGGKSTFINAMIGVIGQKNIGELRTDQLLARFELGNLLGKTVLIANDVPSDFLLKPGATKLKSMVAGDPMSAEIKGVTGQVSVTGTFNVAITSNAVVCVKIDQDLEAWRRRILPLIFSKPKPKNKDTGLLKKILDQEKPGVLNWMLDGLDALRKDNFHFALNEKLRNQTDDFLMASRAPEIFVEDCLEKREGAKLTKEVVNKLYHEYCKGRGWPKGNAKSYPGRIEAKIDLLFGANVSNNIKPEGKESGQVKGWNGIGVKGADMSDHKS
jgi:P4 family phage/plasmid primase-like protien